MQGKVRGLSWQALTKPFIISLMFLGGTLLDKIAEARRACAIIEVRRKEFNAPFAIEINDSCPNVGHNLKGSAPDLIKILEVFETLGVPVGLKFNLLATPEKTLPVANSGLCDYFNIPNTYPAADGPDWMKERARARYLMNKYGACGYSGPWQTPMVENWIRKNRSLGVQLPIIAGSVYRWEDVSTYHDAGANAVALGAVCLVRPWQVNRIIQKSEKYFSTDRKG